MSHRRDDLIKKMIEMQANRQNDVPMIHWEEHKLFYVMLADEGWYMDYDLAIGDLQRLYINQVTNMEGIKELDYYMMKYYKKALPSIIKSLSENAPRRFSIIKKAFDAHKKEDYELSIPTFLSQIDGLCHDLTERGIFTKKGDPIKSWVDKMEDENNLFPVMLSVLEPLRENQNLSANFKEVEDFPNSLNRNRILHGRDLNYANELNSYKAISLLSFVGRIVFDAVNKSETLSC